MFQVASLVQVFHPKSCVHFCFPPYPPHAPPMSLILIWSASNVCAAVQTMQLFTLPLCPIPCCGLRLSPKYIRQRILRSSTLSPWCQTKHLSGFEKRKPSTVHTRPASSFTNGLNFVLFAGTGSHSVRVWTRPNQAGMASPWESLATKEGSFIKEQLNSEAMFVCTWPHCCFVTMESLYLSALIFAVLHYYMASLI